MGRAKRKASVLSRLCALETELQQLIQEEKEKEEASLDWLQKHLSETEQKLRALQAQKSVWQSQQAAARLLFGTQRRYNIILADPPWKYRTPGWRGGTQPHYSIVSTTDLGKLPVLGLAAEDCVLLMWATWPKLEETQALIRSWGFTYKTVFMVWVKQNSNSDRLAIGTGCYTAANSEPLLLATRGHIVRYQQQTNFVSVYVGRRGTHSEKPPIIMDMIFDRFGDLPRMELFSRQRRRGWDAWGNQCANAADEDQRETQLKLRQDRLSQLAHRLVRNPTSPLAAAALSRLKERPSQPGHIYAQTLQVSQDYEPVTVGSQKRARTRPSSIKKRRFQ